MIPLFAIRYSPFAILIFVLSACSSLSLPWSASGPQPDPTAEALFAEGMTYFNNKRYVLAIDRFQKVKAEYPFSPELVPAELKLAEAYYLNKQYPEAAAAFREFQTLHPTNENIPFVLYQLGLVHFEQFTSSDRHQKVTEIARGYFEQVIKNHPNSPHAAPAREKLAKSLEYLSEYEFNVATFYFNERKYPAAIDRLEGIVRRYPTTPIVPKALYYLGESYRLDKNPLKAALAYEALSQHYPNDPLTKTAQAQLSDLGKEKADPLALLLKRDSRPSLASSQPSAISGQQIQEKELNLVAKKEVVHEEPGDQRGILRRVGSALNPLGWFSSDDNKKEDGSKETEAANAEPSKESTGGFFSSLWPWATVEKQKGKPSRDPQLVSKVDDSLKERGIAARGAGAKPPAVDLPKVEEAPPPTDTKELLGKIDASLDKQGKSVAELPAPPEAAPIFKASGSAASKPSAAQAPAASSPALIGSIDEALRRKGIDPAKIESEQARRPGGSEASRPSSQPKVELAPKLPQEKGPLFLDSGSAPVPSKVEGEKAKERPASEPAVARPPKSAAPGSDLPQAILKDPAKEKPAEAKVTEQKKLPGEEEEKSAWDQLREDLKKVQDALNPLNW
jgi:outer membrane protein assembly factor BamD